ncbi:hypothetical protein NEF87_003447 [Candidatus Lokiarchaeum ossiferum]|uniref:DUF4139 domain-containing protein n=1 Tax=Candidatus Lokiarchaeum ossiferum TaxID=2951803 RepID=A0ABY6HUF4_9ARCH|nr:hypothetical protein NEF87_003447 [Candidatus Lokiarchaeum sp. B-35]
MKINPIPKQFIIFSGGGGLIERSQLVSLHPGTNIFDIENVPAAFDPSTTMISMSGSESAALLQVDVKRPDKQIVENFINREKSAAQNIIANATDLRGESRDMILQIIESANYRRYEDMNGSIVIKIDSTVEQEITLQVKYFIEDSRIKWEPSLHIELDEETQMAKLESYILVMNNTDISYPKCTIGFAEFETKGIAPEMGYLEDLEMEQMAQSEIPKNRMMKQMQKVSNVYM